jgi:hypothetical protein
MCLRRRFDPRVSAGCCASYNDCDMMEHSPPDKHPVESTPAVAPSTEDSAASPQHEEKLFAPQGRGWLAGWDTIPLYLRILAAVVLGLVAGMLLGEWAKPLEIPSKLVLRLLAALAGASADSGGHRPGAHGCTRSARQRL